ncbi:MAG TPA: hypothetical protein VFY27_00990 [Woeseiaceae bacterium]|nr:hypothetical protein [Woeseiaceae bacterium]
MAASCGPIATTKTSRIFSPCTYDISTIYAALGDVDETFSWLERALEERSQLIGWLPWDPVFDGIRSDPRYDNLVRRLNLPASPE